MYLFFCIAESPKIAHANKYIKLEHLITCFLFLICNNNKKTIFTAKTNSYFSMKLILNTFSHLHSKIFFWTLFECISVFSEASQICHSFVKVKNLSIIYILMESILLEHKKIALALAFPHISEHRSLAMTLLLLNNNPNF